MHFAGRGLSDSETLCIRVPHMVLWITLMTISVFLPSTDGFLNIRQLGILSFLWSRVFFFPGIEGLSVVLRARMSNLLGSAY